MDDPSTFQQLYEWVRAGAQWGVNVVHNNFFQIIIVVYLFDILDELRKNRRM